LPNAIDAELERNRTLWNVWAEHGVRDGTELTVDFCFYAARAKAGEQLAAALSEAGYRVRTLETRTLLIFKALTIEASMGGEWTLDLLQARTRELVTMADRYAVMFDGLGAELPVPPPVLGA
jgi:hypothetical protein